jgi:agmatine/peptidylarginine deiminase
MVEPGMLNCIKELTSFVKVNIRVRNDTILQNTKARLINYGIEMTNVNLIKFPEVGGFGTSRDTGPAFLINDKGGSMAVDFDYIGVFGGGKPDERTLLTEKRDRN